MQKEKITLPKKYTNKQGEEKTFWAEIGSITTFDNGDKIMELNHLDETYRIFPMDRAEKPNTAQSEAPQWEGREQARQAVQGDDIDLENIPF